MRKDFWGRKPTFGATTTFEAKPSLSELKKLARRTARAIADEYGISRNHIEFTD